MRRLPASLVNAFMLNLALLLTLLLLLKKLFPEIALTGQTLSVSEQTLSETGQTDVRRRGGFEDQRGDLVLELAKVLTQIMIWIKYDE